jgi:hypothetical protein
MPPPNVRFVHADGVSVAAARSFPVHMRVKINDFAPAASFQ